QAGVVVHEPADVLARGLAQLAQEASPAAAGADDERPPLALATFQHRERPEERPLAQARRADEDRAEEPVDDEDALREVAPRALRREDEEVRGELRETHRGDRRCRFARTRVAPDP